MFQQTCFRELSAVHAPFYFKKNNYLIGLLCLVIIGYGHAGLLAPLVKPYVGGMQSTVFWLDGQWLAKSWEEGSFRLGSVLVIWLGCFMVYRAAALMLGDLAATLAATLLILTPAYGLAGYFLNPDLLVALLINIALLSVWAIKAGYEQRRLLVLFYSTLSVVILIKGLWGVLYPLTVIGSSIVATRSRHLSAQLYSGWGLGSWIGLAGIIGIVYGYEFPSDFNSLSDEVIKVVKFKLPGWLLLASPWSLLALWVLCHNRAQSVDKFLLIWLLVSLGFSLIPFMTGISLLSALFPLVMINAQYVSQYWYRPVQGRHYGILKMIQLIVWVGGILGLAYGYWHKPALFNSWIMLGLGLGFIVYPLRSPRLLCRYGLLPWVNQLSILMGIGLIVGMNALS